jgi:hypothetical protein
MMIPSTQNAIAEKWYIPYTSHRERIYIGKSRDPTLGPSYSFKSVFLYTETVVETNKAKGLAEYGGPPGRLKESDPAGVILYVMDGPYRLPFPYHTGCLDGCYPAARLWNFHLLLYSKCTQPSVMSYVTQGRHGLVLQ